MTLQEIHEKVSGHQMSLCVFSLSITSDSVTPRIVARQAPLSMGFPRQEYWSGLSLSPGIFLTQGSNLHLK